MTKFLLPILLLLSCRDPGLVQVGECGKPCYPFNGDAGSGQCRTGLLYCDSDGGTECVGAVGPDAETCDGIDNDCDGTTDEQEGPVNTCKSVCGWGVEVCFRGQIRCTAKQPEPEERDGGYNDCDGIDNDCNGVIDDAQDFPVEFCYDGDPAQLTYPTSQCRPGIKRCAGYHHWICYNETLPRPETCNGKDDNCNGVVDDDTDAGSKPVDLVIVMDNSGSMASSQAAAMQATSTWVLKYGARPEIRFALVFAPDNMASTFTEVKLKQNFTDPATFNMALATSNTNGSGEEPTLDALVLLADYRNPLGLNWNPGANRIVVMYSDEEPQSYFNITGYTGAASPYSFGQNVDSGFTGQLCAQEGIKVYVFTDPMVPGAWNDWQVVTAFTGGTTNSINAGASAIETELDKIIQGGGCIQ